MPETKINTRSPYYLKYTQSGMVQTQIDIYVYSGTKTVDKGTAVATLTKKPLPGDDYVIFEISELIRDELTPNINTPLNENITYVKWVQIESTITT
jgi:hypothetical protein